MKCLVFYSQKPNVMDYMDTFRRILSKLDIKSSFFVIPLSMEIDGAELPKIQEELVAASFVISLGGDGTVLTTAKAIYPSDTPILAVNFGHLGFIAESMVADTEEILKKIVNNEVQIEERVLLEIINLKTKESWIALNEAIIGSNPLHKIGQYEVSVDGKIIASYLADGVVISSPTGSTGYSLSAGGPIVPPHLENLLFVPVCPHTLTSRPLIIDSNSVIDVQVVNRFNQALLIDGQYKIEIEPYEMIQIKKAPHKIWLIYNLDRNYYTTLQSKLNWMV